MAIAEFIIGKRGLIACAVALLVSGALFSAAAARGSGLSVISSGSGTCSASQGSTTASTGAAAHDPVGVIAEIRARGGPGRVDGGFNFGSGDDFWFVPYQGPYSGISTMDVECPTSNFDYTLSLYHMPIPPVSYTGTTSRGVSTDITWRDTFAFRPVKDAVYIADIAVTQGAVAVGQTDDFRYPPTRVTGRKHISLGDMRGLIPGYYQTFFLTGVSDQQSQWRVSVNPRPEPRQDCGRVDSGRRHSVRYPFSPSALTHEFWEALCRHEWSRACSFLDARGIGDLDRKIATSSAAPVEYAGALMAPGCVGWANTYARELGDEGSAVGDDLLYNLATSPIDRRSDSTPGEVNVYARWEPGYNGVSSDVYLYRTGRRWRIGGVPETTRQPG